MDVLSTNLTVAAMFTYLAGMVVLFYSIANLKPTYQSYKDSKQGIKVLPKGQTIIELLGVGVLTIAWAMHATSVVLRGVFTSRIPLGNMYEYGSAIVLIAMAVSLVLLHKKHRNILAFVTFLCLLLLISSLLLFTEAGPVQPALQSYWLGIHVTTIAGSSAVLMIGFVATVLYLVRESSERKVAQLTPETFAEYGYSESQDSIGPHHAIYRDVQKPVWFPIVPAIGLGGFTAIVSGIPVNVIAAAIGGAIGGILLWYTIPALPHSDVLNDLGYKISMFGFPLFTFGILTGAIWAEEAWGRFWGWDPKETASFVTWLIYAAYLHARATTGWKGRRSAWILIVGFLALVFTYYIVNLVISGMHSYATG